MTPPRNNALGDITLLSTPFFFFAGGTPWIFQYHLNHAHETLHNLSNTHTQYHSFGKIYIVIYNSQISQNLIHLQHDSPYIHDNLIRDVTT